MSCNSELFSEILSILAPLTVSCDSINRLRLAYCEEWRTCHNSSHIMQMLKLSRRLNIELSDTQRQRLELMILYHDAWYKVGRLAGENEQASAEWAYADITTRDLHGDAVQLRDSVQQGILATATHTLDQVKSDYHREVATLLDLDLWGLGQTPSHFQEDTEKVWREYQPVATREEFDTGRSAWARSFLNSRKRIYHTKPFLHLEEPARRNLETLAF